MSLGINEAKPRHYLVGGGIASLAAAVFLIRDAKVGGERISIFEQSDQFGGSLDAAGDAIEGYAVRGARMFEEHFTCTFDLLRSIPSLDLPSGSLKDDIFAFNRAVRGQSNCRLVRGGKKVDVSGLGLGPRGILDLCRLLLCSERSLQDQKISNCFQRAFFDTNFWLMWSTMFSFQPWHSATEMRRYLKRFMHLFPGLERIEGILRTRYNQRDSLVAPIFDWLIQRRVRFYPRQQVTDIEFRSNGKGRRVSKLIFADRSLLEIASQDRVYLTLGSITDASANGSIANVPPRADFEGGSWRLWRKLSVRYPGFGNPEKFCGDPAKTTWESFTITLDKPDFFQFMEKFTSNVTGTGGLVTLADSGWLLSIVMFHQPHFLDQAENTFVFWGYGLRGDRVGDFVPKPMWDCTGNEVLTELAGHLSFDEAGRDWFRTAKVVLSRMPYITSQLMPRRFGDRPDVRPQGAQNFAVMGQFCELKRDVVFTIEYSVRSAMAAVHEMTGMGRPPPSVVPTDRSPIVLLRAARKLLNV